MMRTCSPETTRRADATGRHGARGGVKGEGKLVRSEAPVVHLVQRAATAGVALAFPLVCTDRHKTDSAE